MSKWKDETTYSQGTKKRVPRVLAMGLPHGVKLIVHRLVQARDYWFCAITWKGIYVLQDQQLAAVKVEDAKAEGVKLATALLHGWSLEFKEGAQALAMMLDEPEEDLGELWRRLTEEEKRRIEKEAK